MAAQKLQEARRQQEANAQRARRSASRGAAAVPAAMPSGLRDSDVVASVRATVLKCGRKPWWEDPDATVEAHASVQGIAQRQAALRSYGNHPELSAATRSLQPPRHSISLDSNVATESKSPGADPLTPSARSAVKRLNRGLPAAQVFPVGAAARRETRPPPQPIAAEDVAQMLQARLQRRREHALSAGSLRPPGS